MSQNIGIIAFKLVKWGWFLNDWGKEIQITMVIVVFMLSNICSSKLAYILSTVKNKTRLAFLTVFMWAIMNHMKKNSPPNKFHVRPWKFCNVSASKCKRSRFINQKHFMVPVIIIFGPWCTFYNFGCLINFLRFFTMRDANKMVHAGFWFLEIACVG